MKKSLLLILSWALSAFGCATWAQRPTTRSIRCNTAMKIGKKNSAKSNTTCCAKREGTERAFTGKYSNHHEKGNYACAGCGETLFASKDKFESGTGWPSFVAPFTYSCVAEIVDNSYGMRRVEVVCANCGGHLGHVFGRTAPAQPLALLHQLRLARFSSCPLTRQANGRDNQAPAVGGHRFDRAAIVQLGHF